MLLPALEMLHRNVEMSTVCQISAARFRSYDMPNFMCLQRVVEKAFQTVVIILIIYSMLCEITDH